MADNGNKLIIGLLAVVILIAVGVFAYYEWPGSEDDSNSSDQATMLTVTYDGQQWNYSLNDLEGMEAYTGQGSMKTNSGVRDPDNYTGVRFTTLFQDIGVEPVTVSANITAADGYSQVFNQSVLNGDLEVYNQSGNVTSAIATPVLIIAYRQNDAYIDEEDGPLRVVFVGEQHIITNSKYWLKQTVGIDVLHM